MEMYVSTKGSRMLDLSDMNRRSVRTADGRVSKLVERLRI